jgi:uncharacterized protein YeaO (DUF488 family)
LAAANRAAAARAAAIRTRASYFNKKVDVDFVRTNPGAVGVDNHGPFGGRQPSRYNALVPSKKLVDDFKKGIVDEAGYVKVYNQKLSDLNPHKVVADIRKMIGEDAVLLCCEKTGKFCHRNLIAVFLREAGYEVVVAV